jgi:hypothetical protein
MAFIGAKINGIKGGRDAWRISNYGSAPLRTVS